MVKGQNSLDDHTLVPGSAWTELEVIGNTVLVLETDIGQDNRVSLQRFHQRQEGFVRDIGRVPISTHHLPVVVDQPTQLHSDHPAPVALAFLADLLGAATFSDGMDQLNPVAVDDREEGRCRQKAVTPRLMGQQQPL
jgi:hypothetical protein